MTTKTKLLKLNRKTKTISEVPKGIILNSEFDESCTYYYIEYKGSSVEFPVYTPEDGHGTVIWREPGEKPPLGLRPRSIVTSLRIQEIIEAMQRYSVSSKPIPPDWIAELNELARCHDLPSPPS